MLSQQDEEGKLHPVAFHLRKFQPADINYEIHDKELLVIVDAFKHWCRYCEGAVHQVQVFSDHQNLEYFTTTKALNRQQARWAQERAGINFRIYYRPRSRNGKPDTLSRCSEYHPEKGGNKNQPITMVLRKDHFEEPDQPARTFITSSAWLASLPTRNWAEGFAVKVRETGKKDEEYQKVWKLVEAARKEAEPDGHEARVDTEDPREAPRQGRKARIVEALEIKDGLLYRKAVLWILWDRELIRTMLEPVQDS